MASAIWLHESGVETSVQYPGTQGGYDDAISDAGSHGVVLVGPGADTVTLGTIPTGVTVIVLDETGWKVLGTGLITGRLGGDTDGAIRIVDGNTFAASIPGIQAAIDDLPAIGGTVLVPAGTYTGTATLYMPCDRPVQLIGTGGFGPGSGSIGTRLTNSSGNDIIRMRGDYSSIQNLSVIGTGASAAANEETARGIVIGRKDITDPHPAPGTSGNELTLGGSLVGTRFSLKNVRISGTGGWGLFFNGTQKLSDGTTDETNKSGLTLSIWNRIENVTVAAPLKYGAVFIGASVTTTTFYDGAIGVVTGKGGNNANYVHIRQASAIRFIGTTFEGYNGGTASWVYTYGARNIDFISPWFEEDSGDSNTNAPNWFIEMDGLGWGGVIQTARFDRHNSTSAGRLRFVKLTDHNNVTIVNPTGTTVSNAISGGNWIEQNHIDLGGGTNWNVVVVGKGVLINSDSSSYIIQYVNVPRTGTMICDDSLKAPSRSTPQLADVLRQMTEQGQIWYNDDITSADENIECLQYYGAGQQAGARLINNAPTMTRAQRDAYAGFVQGDIIVISNPTVGGREVQIRRGGAWYWLTTTVNIAGD